MPEHVIAGVPVNFPFEPYDVQKAYMEKVITCLRDGTNGVLESPTGTGKTLSLLCSTLAWVLTRKQEIQKQAQLIGKLNKQNNKIPESQGNTGGGISEMLTNPQWNMVPKVIYASRTHSQLTQAMQELKRTSYNFMRSVVLGSRDQLCIHPDVMRESQNSTKIQMCQLRVQTRTCSFHMRVESKKDHPDFRGPTILDIEDLIKVGQKLRMCSYFASKELVADADIIFMPYNYLLDPKARKANKIELKNTIIILDEAHNIEKICEESASVQIRSSDVAMAIEDTTHIMKALDATQSQDFGDEPKEFNLEDLALLKEMLLDLEKAIDEIVVDNKTEGTTFVATFIFELLAKANFNYSTAGTAVTLMEKLLQYLTVASQNSGMRKGASFQKMSDLLTVVFINKSEVMDKVTRSFKVHVQIEEPPPEKKTHNTGWLSKGTTTSSKAGKIINYWCFNPGFGMEQLLNQNVRSVILTSGTLAPLKPLIAELAIPVAHHLENPHIVSGNQVYVKIIGAGPDREELISNYHNRNNPKYISSLGQTILNVSRVVPDGLLVFFPSYPMLNQCVNAWQASGLWSIISTIKPIFVEPRSKDSFTTTMEEFYESIRSLKGACFMAVCRGKVSEGLDFADRNGRAVIITGLPFPPMKDPKVILKRKYLEENRTKENELLTGNAWYSLDATRAVNQAIGRVIRHRNDYGAILLCDARFQQAGQVQQLSKWIRLHLGNTPKSSNFGPIVRELREFFKAAEKTMPQPNQRSIETIKSCTSSENSNIVRSDLFGNKSQPKPEQQKPKLTMEVSKTNTIEDWTPLDYVKAAGQFNDDSSAPKALDFLSRLNTTANVIDYNAVNHDVEKTTNDMVKIHKRIRPTIDKSCYKEKRFKLEILSPLQPSSSSLSMANSNGFNASTETQKEAPQERVDFLRILRSSLSAKDFDDFKAALIAYKGNNSFEELMALLQRVLGKPELHYMLLGMRRFLKTEHKSQFDELVSSQPS